MKRISRNYRMWKEIERIAKVLVPEKIDLGSRRKDRKKENTKWVVILECCP